MNIALWVVQVLLAIAFFAHGWLFLSPPATAYHVVRGEMSSAAITLMLAAMATFVAYMRHGVLPLGVRRTA